MAQNRYYSSTAVETTIVTSPIDSVVTSMIVGSVTNFPAVPFTLALDYNTASEELVTVTNKSGTTLTIVRGVDGTFATSHAVGAVVKHVISARDLSEPQAHMAASTGVHGITGALAAQTDLSAHTSATTGVHGITGALAAASDLSSLSTTVTGLSSSKLDVSGGVVTSPREVATVTATAASSTVNFDCSTQAILYYTSGGSSTFTLNFRGSSTVALDTLMSTGQTITVVFLNTTSTTGSYPNAFKIDTSITVTPKWQGGTAPSAGSASGSVDAYSFTIIKTGAGAFTVLASATRFA